jgi:hypothetical protein
MSSAASDVLNNPVYRVATRPTPSGRARVPRHGTSPSPQICRHPDPKAFDYESRQKPNHQTVNAQALDLPLDGSHKRDARRIARPPVGPPRNARMAVAQPDHRAQMHRRWRLAACPRHSETANFPRHSSAAAQPSPRATLCNFVMHWFRSQIRQVELWMPPPRHQNPIPQQVWMPKPGNPRGNIRRKTWAKPNSHERISMRTRWGQQDWKGS